MPSGENVKSPRLFIEDKISKLLYLIDSGSDISIIPHKFAGKPDVQFKYTVRAANGSKINTYGLQTRILDFGLNKKFIWNFIIADLQYPIIGADFLKENHLLPDLTKKLLIEGKTLIGAPCMQKNIMQKPVTLVISKNNVDEEIKNLIEKFPKLMSPPQYQEEPLHDVKHHIDTCGTPVFSKPRRLRPDVEDMVKDDFIEKVKMGICRRSKSQWSSPIVIVQQKGKIRIVGDYRRLNAQTTPDRYPLPNIMDCTSRLQDMEFFSTIDLVRAYFNIPVFEEDVEKTAVISPAGLFDFKRMPFGLKNAPSTFMRFIQSILQDLSFIFVYIDDILVFSRTREEHIKNLEILFERLNKYGLVININKCEFLKSSVKFLGHEITKNGFKPVEDRVQYIKDLQKPRTISALRKMIGVFTFYRKFHKKAAEYLAKFYDLLKGHPNKNDLTPIVWTAELEEAFIKAKNSFVNFTLLNYPNYSCKMYLTCDASDIALGSVLEQVNDRGEREPLGFFSAKFTDSQRHWSTFDKELYAIYASIEHFSPMVEGVELTLVTDHKPLLYVFSTKKRNLLERRSRWIEFISQYTTIIMHISGLSNIVADTLSRPEQVLGVSEITNPVLFQTLEKEQQLDTEIQNLKKNGFKNQKFQEVNFGSKKNKTIIFCNFYRNNNCPVVPQKLRYNVFLQLHSISHPGIKSTLRQLRSRFYWPGMTKDIKRWSKACHQCQITKVTRHTKSELENFPKASRFEHIHLDVVVLGPDGEYKYLLTMIDRTTKWIEAIPLKDITAESIAINFFNAWVCRFGSPLKVTTDRGRQFTSELFNELCKLIGSHHMETTAYNPKANGMVERVHRRLKAALKSHGRNWLKYLNPVLMGLRASPSEDNSVTCAELVYGNSIKLPGEFYSSSPDVADKTQFVKDLRGVLKNLQPMPRKNSGKVFIHPALQDCGKVYIRIDRVRQPLEPPYEGPYMVKKRFKKFFIIEFPDGKEDSVCIDRLKPAFELSEGESGSVQDSNKSILRKGLRGENKDTGSLVENTLNNRSQLYYSVVEQPVFGGPLSKINIPDINSVVPSVEIPRLKKRVGFTSTTSSGRTIRKPARFR